jgi:hypothetical protein
MEPVVCQICRKPKANLNCGLCGNSVCKKCSEKLPENRFAFRKSVPAELTHRLYCATCFMAKVAPAIAEYDEILERAKNLNVFNKGQGEETRLMSRTEKPLKVTDCADKKETLMRLAFRAAEAGFNCLLDVAIVSTKVRNHGYQNTKWEGSGVPTNVDEEKLERLARPGKVLLPLK